MDPRSEDTIDKKYCLTSDTGAAREARRSLGDLERRVPSGTMEQLRLLVSEVVTNAVRHSGVGPDGYVGLRVVSSPGSVRVEVSDPGPGFGGSRLSGPDPNSGSGYGLYLVQELADRWGTGSEDGLTSVWFKIGHGDPGSGES